MMCNKQIYLSCIVFMLLAVPLVTYAQVENLALNPSFEEDEVILNDPDWEAWCTWSPDDVIGNNVELDESEFIDGKRSLRVEPVGVENWHLVVANISIPVQMGSEYTASFWVKAEEARPLTASFKAADNTVSWGETGFEVTTEWAEYSMTSESLSDELKLEIFCAGSEIPLWLDFVYIYEGAYVAGINPTPPLKASEPVPVDSAFIEETWVNLGWQAGDLAVSHDVYLGDNFDGVNDGAADTFRGNQAAAFYVAGFPGFAYPDGLVPGKTYYWRIDEVNEADPNSPWKGDVWSFTVTPQTAHKPEPTDSAGSIDLNVVLSWKAGYAAKLHTVYVGDNFDDVNNAAGGPPQGLTTYTPGSLKSAKTYYWRVDEFDGTETYKGDVWSFSTEGAIANPNPSNDAVDVKQAPILSWTAGVYAASHQVYFGTDQEAVKNADTSSPEYKGTKALGEEDYEPGKLAWDTTHYWRVDEVNSTNPDSPWVGPVWSFTTAGFAIVDNFEDYDAGDNQIWYAWHDGLGYGTPGTADYFAGNGTGAAVGDENTLSYTEETIVHGGNQSMPISYDNNKQGYTRYSEVELTLTDQRDWTEGDVADLSLWFRGNPASAGNAPESLYVALSNSFGTPAVVYQDDPAAATIDTWTEWIIPLQAFADQGINLANVDRIAIGLGTQGNMGTPGGSGKMFIDDIRLYKPNEAAE